LNLRQKVTWPSATVIAAVSGRESYLMSSRTARARSDSRWSGGHKSLHSVGSVSRESPSLLLSSISDG
jgi:hypothetical protein